MRTRERRQSAVAVAQLERQAAPRHAIGPVGHPGRTAGVHAGRERLPLAEIDQLAFEDPDFLPEVVRDGLGGLDPGVEPQEPPEVSFPQLIIMVPLAVLLTVVSTSIGVVLKEVLDQRVRSPADVAMIARARVLGMVPHRAEVPGRPLQYGTTPQFLERFGLGSLQELPSIKEWKSLG